MIQPTLALALLSCTIALAQSPTAPRAFEVASIRPHPGPLHVMMGFTSSGPRLNLEAYAPIELVMEAYDLKDYQVAAASSLKLQDTIFYDIAAKAEGDATPSRADFRQMLQTLLAQRFNFKYHFETRQLPVYVLVVARNGPKFHPGSPRAPDSDVRGVHGRNQTLNLAHESMSSLAQDIQNVALLDRPVVDRTGLAGTYNIQLEATPQFRIDRNPSPEDISIFTAVQEQLGLKLEPAKAPVQVLVIDHLDNPSPN